MLETNQFISLNGTQLLKSRQMKIIRHAKNYNNINMLGGFKLGSGDCCVYLEVLDVYPWRLCFKGDP